MSFEHLRMWLCASTREEDPDLVNIQAAFRGGELVASCAWKTVVMIPKGGRHHLQRYWPVGGPLEVNFRHHQSPDIVFHIFP